MTKSANQKLKLLEFDSSYNVIEIIVHFEL